MSFIKFSPSVVIYFEKKKKSHTHTHTHTHTHAELKANLIFCLQKIIMQILNQSKFLKKSILKNLSILQVCKFNKNATSTPAHLFAVRRKRGPETLQTRN